jgi:phage baseplate assembly protein W
MPDHEKLFGNDLRLAERAPGFDLIPDVAGDLDLAQGNENIIQALILRLKVKKGELAPLGWPNYGSRLHELIGEPNNSRTHVMLMAHARNAIEQDPRVAEVKEVRTEVLPGEREVVRIIMDILLINAPNPLNLVFDMNLESP